MTTSPSVGVATVRTILRPGGIPLNTILVALRSITLMVVGILMLPMLIDRIGQAATGLFIFATTLTGYFTAVELGLATSVTKYTAQLRSTGDSELLNSVLRGSLLLMAAIGGVIAIVLGILAVAAGPSLFDEPQVTGEAVSTLLVAAAVSVVYWPSRVGTAALEGLERYDLRAIVGIGVMLAALGGLYVLTGITDSLPVLVGFFGGLLVLEGVVCGAIAWPGLGVRRGKGRWLGPHLRSVLAFGSALFIIGMADTLVYAADRTIVAAFVGASAIVIYESALRPHNGIRVISALAGSALISTSSRMVAEARHDRLRELVFFGSFLGIAITTPFVVLVMVLAEPLLDVWLGSDFVQYAVYVQLLVSYWLIHANTSVLGSVVTGIGRLRPFVVLTMIGALSTIAISIPAASAFGTVGVIWGIVIPAWLGMPIWMFWALKVTEISKLEYARRVALPAYALLAVWTAVVIAAKQAIEPTDFAALAGFGFVALALFWALAARPVWTRWQRALAYAAAP